MQVLAVAVPEGGPAPSTLLKAFRAKHKLTYPLVGDDKGAIAARFGVSFLPDNVILNQQGKLVAKPEDVGEMVKTLQKLTK